MPFFSILIPTYEQPALIDRCISGILQQDFQDFELVISDDSRDDATKNIVQTYHDARIRFFKNEPALGRVSNYQHLVLQHAIGKWILICDGDDYITHSSYLSEVYLLIQKYPSLVWLQAGHVKGESLEKGVMELPLIGSDYQIMSGKDYLLEYPKIHHFSHLSTVSRADIMKSINPFRLNILSADMETYFRVAAYGDICLIRKSVGLWYQHGKNASSTEQLTPYFQNLKWIESVFDFWVKQYLADKVFFEDLKNKRLKDTLLFEIKNRLLKNKPSWGKIFKMLRVVLSIPSLRKVALKEKLFYSYLFRALRGI